MVLMSEQECLPTEFDHELKLAMNAVLMRYQVFPQGLAYANCIKIEFLGGFPDCHCEILTQAAEQDDSKGLNNIGLELICFVCIDFLGKLKKKKKDESNRQKPMGCSLRVTILGFPKPLF